MKYTSTYNPKFDTYTIWDDNNAVVMEVDDATRDDRSHHVCRVLNKAYAEGRESRNAELAELLEIGAAKLEKLNKVAEKAEKLYAACAPAFPPSPIAAPAMQELRAALDDLQEKKKFLVEVREVWVSTREVMATSEEEAKELVAKDQMQAPVWEPDPFEYSHTLDPSTWTVKVEK